MGGDVVQLELAAGQSRVSGLRHGVEVGQRGQGARAIVGTDVIADALPFPTHFTSTAAAVGRRVTEEPARLAGSRARGRHRFHVGWVYVHRVRARGPRFASSSSANAAADAAASSLLAVIKREQLLLLRGG